MKDRYALEARKLSVKVSQQATHIDILDEQVHSLRLALKAAQTAHDELVTKVWKLEDFVKFASEYYPGCIAQYHVINKLEIQ